MRNKIIFIKKEKLQSIRMGYVVEINGEDFKTKDDFINKMEVEFRFPRKCDKSIVIYYFLLYNVRIKYQMCE